MIKFFDGSKTYVCAALLAIASIWEFIAKGDFSITALIALGQSASIAGAIAALRHAFEKTAPVAK